MASQVTPEEYETGQRRLSVYRDYCAELKAQGQVGATWHRMLVILRDAIKNCVD